MFISYIKSQGNVSKTEIMIIILIVTLFVAGYCTDCDSGWTEYNEHCYKYWTDTVTYREATQLCDLEGSEILCVDDAAEMDFIEDLLVNINIIYI